MLPPQLDSLRAFVASRPAPRAGGVRADVGPSVLVVGSGKGGTGTSVVAALLAVSAAALGRRVLLVDLDEHVGPQRYLLGVRPTHALSELRQGLAPSALLVPVSTTLTLLPGGPVDGVAQAGDTPALAPAERRALLRRVAECYADHDLIVIDAGSRLDTVRAGVEGARAAAEGRLPVRLLVVSGTDPIALASSYALVKSVAAADADGATLPVDLLVNRVGDDEAQLAHEHLATATRQFLQHPLHFAGALPDDASLAVALRAGMPLQDAAVGSPAAIAMDPIATHLIELSPAAPAARGGRSAAPARTAGPGSPPAPRTLRSAATLAYSGSPLGSAR